MLKRIFGNEQQTVVTFAKQVINALAGADYLFLKNHIDDLGSWQSVEHIQTIIEGYLQTNELNAIDNYDTPCHYQVVYSDGSSYQQERISYLQDDQGIIYEYDFTSNSALNDLSLSLTFLLTASQIHVIFEPGLTVL